MYGKIPQGIYLQLLEVPALLTAPVLVWKIFTEQDLLRAKPKEVAFSEQKKREKVYMKPNLLPFLESG